MNVLVINAGSSSLKYQLINVTNHEVLARGICERVGSDESFHKHGIDGNEYVLSKPMENHIEAVELVLDVLLHGEDHPIESIDEIDAVGHRIVQGGKYFDKSVIIDDDVKAKIEELAELAPLHNKAALLGIAACEQMMPNTPMVAVFDTSFFQTLPPRSYMYPIPYEYYKKYDIRRYGAHGTSHRFIAHRAAEFIDERLQDLKMITCHLGNGCSITAIDHGNAIDTSMGLTPLDGLMMGTRCGSIDPAIVTFLMDHEDLSPQEVNDVLNKQSGILGISGISNDLRSIIEASETGDERAMLAYEMYANSVKKYIGQYIAIMGGVDVIVLAGGVGENSEKMRRLIFAGLQPIGIVLDEQRNREGEREREISTDRSPVRILIVPTNEEAMIALDTFDLTFDIV